MTEAVSADFDEILDLTDVNIFDTKTLENPALLKGPRASYKDAFTQYTPPKPEEPKATPFQNIPTLPLPEQPGKTTSDREQKRKEELAQLETRQEQTFSPFGHFGMPFKTGAGTEVGFTPHPQVIMARTLEDCTHTMAVGRQCATDTILKIDHPHQEKVGKEHDEKLLESIRIANENKHLDYVQSAVRWFTITTGIAGGIIVALSGSSLSIYGIEMAIGGMLELGTLALEQFGYENSSIKTLASIGAIALTLHGGLMAKDVFKGQLMSLVQTCWGTYMSMVEGYTNLKQMKGQMDMTQLTGELVTLTKLKREGVDAIQKHYGALNIKDFAHLFRTATEFVKQSNQAVKNIIQSTLKG